MINILHFIDQYKIGGRGKTIINSSKFIDSKLFKIHIASFVRENDVRMELNSVAQASGIPSLTLSDSKGISFKNILALTSYMKTHHIDILHTHDYKTDLIGILLVKCVRLRLILVSTHHGWILNSIRQKFFQKIDLHLSRYFHGIITVSQALFLKLPKRTRQAINCSVIHNAIVLSDYQRQNKRERTRRLFNVRPNQILVGVIGRLSVEKGCLDILEALHLLVQQKDNVILIFIGEGPLAAELQSRIDSLNLDDKVIMSGHHNSIQPFYEALDILVCPSHTEGISNVILEAMVTGVPIIATRVGGTPELLKDRRSGLLVEPKNKKVLNDTLCTMIDNADLRLSLVQNAKAIAKERFSFQDRMKKVESFYLDLLRRKRHASQTSSHICTS